MKKLLLMISILSSSLFGTIYEITPTPEERDSFLLANPKLSEYDIYRVKNATFDCGMSDSVVVFLFGRRPDKIKEVMQPWGKQELWLFKKEKFIFIIEDHGVVGILEDFRKFPKEGDN